MTPPLARASFDLAPRGYRFTLRYGPDKSCSAAGTVILAPAFAEEMNRCRRMTSIAANRLACGGWRVLSRDLFGCGDSSGDFADASWQAWIDDLTSLLTECPASEPLWLLGVRAGALILPAVLEHRPDANLLLWQPAVSGRNALNQFLRLKTVATALGGEERIDVKTIRASLLSGQPEEIAGYTISPSLAAGMDAAALDLPDDFRGKVVWLEVSASEPIALLPAGEGLRTQWASRGLAVSATAVGGDQFWQTQETTECPALLEATEQLMMPPPRPSDSRAMAGALSRVDVRATPESIANSQPTARHGTG